MSLFCVLGSWPSFLCTYILPNFTDEEKGAQRSSVTGRAAFCPVPKPMCLTTRVSCLLLHCSRYSDKRVPAGLIQTTRNFKKSLFASVIHYSWDLFVFFRLILKISLHFMSVLQSRVWKDETAAWEPENQGGQKQVEVKN